MNNFKQYQNELFMASKSLSLDDVLNHYALPNFDEVHSMICGYADERLILDTSVFDCPESIDCFRYEKELWRINKQK